MVLTEWLVWVNTSAVQILWSVEHIDCDYPVQRRRFRPATPGNHCLEMKLRDAGYSLNILTAPHVGSSFQQFYNFFSVPILSGLRPS
jgi:hypothetical protein